MTELEIRKATGLPTSLSEYLAEDGRFRESGDSELEALGDARLRNAITRAIAGRLPIAEERGS